MEEESDHSDLTARLEEALQKREIENRKSAQSISALLHRSVQYGRANRVLGENSSDDDGREYVDKVINYYKEHHGLVACLDRGDSEAWQATMKNIHAWANGFFTKHDIYGPLKDKAVEECTSDAVLAYLSSTYHYDTDFDAWLCVLVQNVCRKYIKDQCHPNRQKQGEAVSYDEYEFLREALADNNQINSQKARELREDLLEAVEKLSSNARLELIILHYFEGYSLKEIAEKMNKTMNAIYKLHFDALNELREIWLNK